MTYKKLKKRLDEVFSLYIRLRDKNKVCISCGKKSDNKEAGHFYSRSVLSLRWDGDNVNGQCVYCNQNLKGNLPGYENGIIQRYGRGVLDRLERTSSMQVKFKIFELSDMIDIYEEKIKKIFN